MLRAKKIEIFDVRSAFRTNSLPGSGSSSANNSLGRSLRNDLLVAADSVTNAMSTLVRELNSGMSNNNALQNRLVSKTINKLDVDKQLNLLLVKNISRL